MTKLLPALAAALVALTPAVASASTMPKADFGGGPLLGLGVGYGAAASIDVPLNSRFAIGAAFYSYRLQVNGLEARLLYKLANIERIQLDLMGGVEGYGVQGNALGIGPFLGLAAALPLTDRLTGRLNLGFSPLDSGYLGATGIELGYKFSNRLEGTFGFSGHGDILGIKYYL